MGIKIDREIKLMEFVWLGTLSFSLFPGYIDINMAMEACSTTEPNSPHFTILPQLQVMGLSPNILFILDAVMCYILLTHESTLRIKKESHIFHYKVLLIC